MAEHNVNLEGSPIGGVPPAEGARRKQQCSASMRTGLAGYWNFAPSGATTVPAGAPPGVSHTLTLGRTSRSSGSSISVTAGWTVEPDPPAGMGATRPTFNGHGSTSPLTELSLANPGDGVTIAARFWLKGGNIQGGAGPLAKAVQIFGLAGQYGSGSESGMSVFVPDASLCLNNPPTATFAIRLWSGAAAVMTTLDGSTAWAEPMLVLLTLVRSGANVVCQLYVNGDAAGPSVAIAASAVDLSRITFGDAVESDGSVTEAAVWSRALLANEIAGLAYDLTCVYGEATNPNDPEEWPLLNDDGTTAVAPEWLVPLEHGHGVLSSSINDRGNRETRLSHERRPRRYGLRIRLGNGREALILKEVLRTTGMGAKWTRWRHPKDDPAGPPETAPRYIVRNAADGAISLRRSGGGAIADFTLELEEL